MAEFAKILSKKMLDFADHSQKDLRNNFRFNL